MLIGISGRTDSGKEQLYKLLFDLLRPIDDLTIKFIYTKEELKDVKNRGGYIIRIEKNTLGYYFTNELQTKSNLSIKETELDDAAFDFVISNNYQVKFEQNVKNVVEHIKELTRNYQLV